MTDSNLVRVLQRQSRGPVGLLPHAVVDQGPAAIRARLGELRAAGIRQAIADAVSERHLIDLGAGAADLALITGGSGIAMGLPANFRRQGRLDQTAPADALAHVEGQAAILSGSCSAATLARVERHRAAGRAVMILDPVQLAEGAVEVERALAFAERHIGQGPVLFSSSPRPKRSPRSRRGSGAGGQAP